MLLLYSGLVLGCPPSLRSEVLEARYASPEYELLIRGLWTCLAMFVAEDAALDAQGVWLMYNIQVEHQNQMCCEEGAKRAGGKAAAICHKLFAATRDVYSYSNSVPPPALLPTRIYHHSLSAIYHKSLRPQARPIAHVVGSPAYNPRILWPWQFLTPL